MSKIETLDVDPILHLNSTNKSFEIGSTFPTDDKVYTIPEGHTWMDVSILTEEVTDPISKAEVFLYIGTAKRRIAVLIGGTADRFGQTGKFPSIINGSIGTLVTPGERFRLEVLVNGKPIQGAFTISTKKQF